jgi:cystathionine beta-lyase
MPAEKQSLNMMLNELKLFGMGYSWGGFESLAIPFDARTTRTATQWDPQGPTVRLHIGLEDVEDLLADLERGLAKLRSA